MGKKLSWLGSALLRHKYFWTILVFIIIVGGIDTNSLSQRYQLHAANEELRSEIAQYDKQYAEDSKALKELQSNQEAVEDVARLRLFMKTDNEDVYVIDDKQ